MNFSTNNIKIGKVNTYGNNVGAKINFGSSSNLKNTMNINNIYETPKETNFDEEPVDKDIKNPEPTETKIDKESIEKKTNELINSIKEEVLDEEGNGPRKYIDWYYGEGAGVVDWCAIFVNWIFNHNGDSGLYSTHGEGNAVAGEDIKTAIAEGRGEWFESEYTDSNTTPQPGDVVTFNWVSSDGQLKSGYDEEGNLQQWKYQTPQGSDHVGYVYDVDDEYIYTIEGNANSYEASAATVTTKKWPRTDININGYYRPNYSDAV